MCKYLKLVGPLFSVSFPFYGPWIWLRRSLYADSRPKSVKKGRSSDWMVTVDSIRYRPLESCNRPPPWPPIWMPLGLELSKIFHRSIWIDGLKIYLLPHLVRYLEYHWWFIYYGQISKTCRAIFLNFGLIFVLYPSEFGSDGVFTRIFEGLKSVQKGRSSDWIVTMDSRSYILLQPCNRPPSWPLHMDATWSEN